MQISWGLGQGSIIQSATTTNTGLNNNNVLNKTENTGEEH